MQFDSKRIKSFPLPKNEKVIIRLIIISPESEDSLTQIADDDSFDN